jgi:hypothetical protein
MVEFSFALICRARVYYVDESHRIEILCGELPHCRRVCNAIDVENFRKVISDPDAWVIVENRDHCAGLYRNGTIAWLGPHNFARVFKVFDDPAIKLTRSIHLIFLIYLSFFASFAVRLLFCQDATDAQLDNCLVDFPPSAFNSSLFRPDFVAAYARAAAAHIGSPDAILDAIPRGCKEVQPFFVNLIMLNIVQIVTAVVMVLALVTAMTLSMCKFQGYTVEGFLTEDEDPNSSSQYFMLS